MLKCYLCKIQTHFKSFSEVFRAVKLTENTVVIVLNYAYLQLSFNFSIDTINNQIEFH